MISVMTISGRVLSISGRASSPSGAQVKVINLQRGQSLFDLTELLLEGLPDGVHIAVQFCLQVPADLFAVPDQDPEIDDAVLQCGFHPFVTEDIIQEPDPLLEQIEVCRDLGFDRQQGVKAGAPGGFVIFLPQFESYDRVFLRQLRIVIHRVFIHGIDLGGQVSDEGGAVCVNFPFQPVDSGHPVEGDHQM